MNSAKAFDLAWRILPKLPRRLVESAASSTSRVIASLRTKGVRQLENNIVKLTGTQPSKKQIRDAVASYAICYAQQFCLSGWSSEELDNACDYPGASQTLELMKDGPVVLALTHSGNWDLAGAWFCKNYGPIVTVAEKLDPPELFQKFLDFRESLGMEIIGVGKGEHIFEELVRKVQGRSVLVPLLADRDISGSGIEVSLGTRKALVAAGPAALALKLGCPLIAGHIVYKRNAGKYNIEAKFSDPIPTPPIKKNETAVEALTKAWVKKIEPIMAEGSTHWHMLQKLYVDDLDKSRLERARAKRQNQIDGKASS